MRALSPALEWSDETYKISELDYHVQHLIWMLSEDGAKGTNRPTPPDTPATVERNTRRLESTDFELIASVLPYERP